MSVSAERICLVLKGRGMPTANVDGYKAVLRGLDLNGFQCVDFHLRRVQMGAEDRPSLAFMAALTELARGKVITTEDPVLQALKPSKQQAHPRYTRPLEEVAETGGMVPAQATLRTAKESDVSRKKHYVYGQRCAFMFELDWLKLRPNQGGQKRTLTIEAADQLALRSYDWERRVSFQLTLLELPQFTAVLLGKLPHDQVWAVGNHGRSRDKFLRAKEQFNSLFLKIEQAGRRWPIKVGQEHRYQILALALEALRHNDDHLDLSTITQLCEAALPRNT